MASVEENSELGQQIVADAKRHVLYSWSVQDAINPIAVAGAEGRYFWDYDGKRYLDFASQLVNVSIGYGHPKIVAAIKEQAETLATIGPPMATESRSRLGKLLAEVTPGDLSMSMFTNGGAEANENAIKLARWYTGRQKVVARYRSYHGATAGAITLTGDPRRWPAEPGIPGVVRMLDPYTYRCPAGHPDPCPVCSGGPHLEELLMYEGPETVAAVILETITGTNGIIVPPDGYLQSIREVCDRHGILLIADEVMAGFGRTGQVVRGRQLERRPRHHHAREGHQLGLRPARRDGRLGADRRLDAAALLRRRADLLGPSARLRLGGRLDRGLPGGGHRRERRRDRASMLGVELARLAERHPSIGEVRGLGCFFGLELVSNRETREPLVPFNGDRGARPSPSRPWPRARSRTAST